MKLRHLLCCALAAVVSSATTAAAQRPPVESDQQILIELERGWNDAFYRKDVGFISISSPTSSLRRTTMAARATRPKNWRWQCSSISRWSRLFRKTSRCGSTVTPPSSGSRCM